MSLYSDWVKGCIDSEMNNDFVDYVVETRNGKPDEKLLDTYLKAGILGVPDREGELLTEHLNNINHNITELGFKESETYKLGNGFIIPVWSSTMEPLFFISYNPDREKDPKFKSGKYINVMPDGKREQLSSMRIYGLENTAQALKEKVLFVSEGVFDKLRLQAEGLPACSTLGSEIGLYHKRVFSRFEKIVYIGDNDAPGKKSRDSFLKMLPKTVVYKVPRGKDIDEFGAKYPKEFDAFISELKRKYMQ